MNKRVGNVFEKQVRNNQNIWACYEVANLITHENKCFSDEEFVKICISVGVKEIIPE